MKWFKNKGGETFSGVEFSRGVVLAKEISSLMPDERTAQWAIRWILDHPAVTTVIPGAAKVSQVISNDEATLLPALSAATYKALRVLYDEKIKAEIRGCIRKKRKSSSQTKTSENLKAKLLVAKT